MPIVRTVQYTHMTYVQYSTVRMRCTYWAALLSHTQRAPELYAYQRDKSESHVVHAGPAQVLKQTGEVCELAARHKDFGTHARGTQARFSFEK